MQIERRSFLKGVIAAGAAPVVVPSSVFGATAPSNKVQVAIIGLGRIGCSMDIEGCARNEDVAMLTTVCDCDRVRLGAFRDVIARHYNNRNMDHVKYEMDYRKVLDDPGVDGVLICTPDHWHARMAVEACLKGKDIYVQKPMAFSIEQSLAIVEAVRKTKRIFYIGTQGRSDRSGRFGNSCRRAAEYVKSGRLGKLARIEVGIIDNSPAKEWDVPLMEETPNPRDFNFDMWLGPAHGGVPYSQLRTHWRRVDENGRPYSRFYGQNSGWLQIQDYCMGNVTGWGTHMVDQAQWPMDELGPVSVKAELATFMKGRLFNIHDDMRLAYEYPNGVHLTLATWRAAKFPVGVKFCGENGDWIWSGRSMPKIPEEKRVDTAYKPKADFWRYMEANKKEIIAGEPEVTVQRNTLKTHHRIWFLGMRERKDTHIPVEAACSSTISCILGYHALNNPGRAIGWDPVKFKFTNPEDEKLFSTYERPGYSVAEIMKEIRKRG